MMSKKSPQLRFEGFTDDWEVRKLNEVSDIYDGTHQTPKYQDNGVMFLSVENIKTLTSNKFISREAFEDEFKIRPQRGDVLMTRIGDIGTANVVETDEDLAYYVSLALFKSEELNPYFLQASIYAPFVQDQIWKRTLHIAFPKKINKNEIGQVPINVPTLAEQTKIGSFFKQLDKTIALHQRKLDLLKEQKKGYLQKMFPKNGAKVPELRFAGFADDWEERKVSEITDFHKQGFYTKESYNENKKYYLLRGSDMTSNKLILKDTPKINASEKDYEDFKVLKDDFLIVRSGTVGTYAIVKSDITAIFGSYLINFRFNQSIVLNEFFGLFYQSSLFKSQLNKIIQKSSNININAENIKGTNIKFPTIEEQQKIGDYFSNLDEIISLHQRKLDLLKEQKKGFLQTMFAK